MCARLFPEPEYFLCVKTDANCPKIIPGKLLNPKQIILKKNLNDLREREKKKKERKETLRRKSSISRHPCGASHGELRPVNDQQDNSQRLSSKITAMAVCLTSTVTSSLLLLLFFPPSLTSSPVIKVGKLNTLDVLCFHLVVTVTQKHGAAVNEIPVCHQSPADKDVIVVLFE